MLKEKVVGKVDASKNESLLQDVLDILSDSSLDENEVHYRTRLEASIQQADAGKVFTAEHIHQIARQHVLAGTTSLNEAQQNEDDKRWNVFLKD